MDNSMNTTAPIQPQSPVVLDNKKPTGLIIATAVCATLAVAGTAFGIYGLVDSGQKSQQVSDLKSDVASKDAKITELEAEVLSLSTKNEGSVVIESGNTVSQPEQETNKNDGTAAILLGDKLAENGTRAVFKLGECTADGPSVKCPVTVNGEEALISYVTSDGILRLTLSNN